MADPVEMKLLHMITADPARTPTFTLFADSNYFLFAGAANCNSPCTTEPPGFAWNHGDVQSDIVTTWLGMVGPGVAQVGVDSETWTDHTDIRPTMMVLLGLNDDYQHDGRLIFEDLNGYAVPAAVHKGEGIVRQLAEAYKRINAPVGQLGLASLVISTRALESGNATDDTTYANLENQLVSFTSRRNGLASQMKTMLENAAFNGQPIDKKQAQSLIDQANQLLNDVTEAAE